MNSSLTGSRWGVISCNNSTAFLVDDGADYTVTGIVNQPGVQTGTLDPGRARQLP
jgi:hypothetical protein